MTVEEFALKEFHLLILLRRAFGFSMIEAQDFVRMFPQEEIEAALA